MAANVELVSGTLVNTGQLTFDPGAHGTDVTDVNLNLANQGTTTVATGNLMSSGTYSQTAGTTTIAARASVTLLPSRPLTLGGGLVTGSGTVAGSILNNQGTVDPGSVLGAGPPRTLTVTGNYTQGPNGTLAIDIGATGNDVLAVQGTANVAGTLISHTMKGYNPKIGDEKTILTGSGGLTWTVACAITSGHDSSSGHWQPAPAAMSLPVSWQSGSVTSC